MLGEGAGLMGGPLEERLKMETKVQQRARGMAKKDARRGALAKAGPVKSPASVRAAQGTLL